MKGTESFKITISDHLKKKSQENEKFAEQAKKAKESGKNIDDCIQYILNTVKATECSGFTDGEIFSIAERYYTEEVDIGSKIDMQVVVNHEVQLTDEEKESLKKKAIEKFENEVINKRKNAGKKPVKVVNNTEEKSQASLF